MMIDLAAAWAKTNFSHAPARQDFLRDFGRSTQNGGECSFAIGPFITKKRKPYLVYGLADQFFVFTLGKEQAKRLGAVKDGMVKRPRRSLVAPPPSTELPISVSNLEIESKSYLINSEPIVVRCHCESQGELPDPITACFQVDLHGVGNSTRWITLCNGQPIRDLLSKSGTIELKFPPIHEPEAGPGEGWTGTTVAFIRFFTMPDRTSLTGRVPLSHAAGTLIDVFKGQQPETSKS